MTQVAGEWGRPDFDVEAAVNLLTVIVMARSAALPIDAAARRARAIGLRSCASRQVTDVLLAACDGPTRTPRCGNAGTICVSGAVLDSARC